MVWVLSHSFISYESFGKCFLFSEPQLPYHGIVASEITLNVFKTTAVVVLRDRECKEVPSTVRMVPASAQMVVIFHVIITNKLDQRLDFHSSMKLTF